MLKNRIVKCDTKKELIDNIIDYIKDGVIYIAVLKEGKKWGYIVLDFQENENETFLEELNKLDSLSVILQGYENNINTKLSLSKNITYFRNEYAKNNALEELKKELNISEVEAQKLKELFNNKNYKEGGLIDFKIKKWFGEEIFIIIQKIWRHKKCWKYLSCTDCGGNWTPPYYRYYSIYRRSAHLKNLLKVI
jgi:hypothetical protein